MRIICTVTNDLSQDQRMDRICRSLVREGHQVTLVGRELPNSRPLIDKPYQQHRLSLRYHRGKRFYLEYNWTLFRWLQQQEVDVINSVDLDTLLAGYWAKSPEQKLVFDAHEYFSETPEVIDRPFVQGVWRKLAKWLIPKTDLCYTVGPELAKIFRKKYGKSFGVVRNVPLAKSAVSAKQSNNRRIILYQGMLNRGRGLDVVIEAMRQLPHCELWLAGHGDELERLQSSYQDLVQQGRVKFLGFIPMEQLPALTAKAWLGLNLLDAVSPSYYFSLANKCFDYIQAGLPSIQMNFPEYRAINTQFECMLLLPELNVSKLVNMIQLIQEQPEKYQRMQQQALLAAKELNWEREELRLLSMWAEVSP
ncbi:MAG: glycosyltransferase [Bacteroidota bacterium]